MCWKVSWVRSGLTVPNFCCINDYGYDFPDEELLGFSVMETIIFFFNPKDSVKQIYSYLKFKII
jgi:hypothetical protein